MTQKIKSIEKGWGEDSTYYSTEERLKGRSQHVDKVTEETKQIGPGRITVYRGYRSANMIFEIEAGGGITLTFWEE